MKNIPLLLLATLCGSLLAAEPMRLTNVNVTIDPSSPSASDVFTVAELTNYLKAVDILAPSVDVNEISIIYTTSTGIWLSGPKLPFWKEQRDAEIAERELRKAVDKAWARKTIETFRAKPLAREGGGA